MIERRLAARIISSGQKPADTANSLKTPAQVKATRVGNAGKLLASRS